MTIVTVFPDWLVYIGTAIWYFSWIGVAVFTLSIGALGLADVCRIYNQCSHYGRIRDERRPR